jgi:hypothetical protein
MVLKFLEEAVLRQINECQEQDDIVIRALNNSNDRVEDRAKSLYNWLKAYGVFQGLTQADRLGLVRAIIEYADSRPDADCILSEAEIIKRFAKLYQRCGPRVRPKMDGTPRDLTSLTSKALWCCYPHSIPIFDAYALRGLWAISRLDNLDRPPLEMQYSPYSRFVAVWLSIYKRVESLIAEDHLQSYPYKVRVFDKILWIVGQPDFGATPYDVR